MTNDMEEKKRTAEYIKKVFNTDLGRQLNSIFQTPDGRPFIRYEEAVKHCEYNNLEKCDIYEWFEVYSGTDPEPTYQYEVIK